MHLKVIEALKIIFMACTEKHRHAAEIIAVQKALTGLNPSVKKEG